jgi:L-seryl-tRNA(Ser) seleniumtransferase
MKDLRSLPSVDHLLQIPVCQQLLLQYGHPLVINTLRSQLDDIRMNHNQVLPSEEQIIKGTAEKLSLMINPSIKKVINATGVILHTNLGRSPLSKESIAEIEIAASNYTNLEFNLKTGTRGSRHDHCEELLTRLSGTEAAMVVNNNASALLLVLSALFNRKKVAISRSQLVEIGGGFRVPDVMRQSGAKMIEIGTTNHTHLTDYREALAAGAVGVVRVHTSNFKIIGFTSIPELQDVVNETHLAGALVIDDLGSGSFLKTEDYGLTHEPMVQESVKAGVDVICFSGDKLLGGPQAGIIIGRKDLLNKLKKHPLARAIRADKLCLAGLSATLIHYLKDEVIREIPVWKMISMETDVIRQRALNWMEQLHDGKVIQGESTVGGGSLPGDTLPTWLFALKVRSPEKMLKLLRNSNPAIIGRIVDDQVVFDPRTVFEDEENDLVTRIAVAYHQNRNSQ